MFIGTFTECINILPRAIAIGLTRKKILYILNREICRKWRLSEDVSDQITLLCYLRLQRITWFPNQIICSIRHIFQRNANLNLILYIYLYIDVYLYTFIKYSANAACLFVNICCPDQVVNPIALICLPNRTNVETLDHYVKPINNDCSTPSIPLIHVEIHTVLFAT